MRIVVNHLTRMRSGYICVAGIDPDTGKHVRPHPESARWRKPDLVRRGGPFDIGAVVDLGRVSYIGKAPELEDYRVSANRARWMEDCVPHDFWSLLTQVAQTRLTHIFGDDLHLLGRNYVVDVGKGIASLGCLALSKPPILHVTAPNEVRLSFTGDPDGPSLKVTDLRLYEGEQAAVRYNVIQDMARRMEGAGIILSVGLGRPWLKAGDTVERHWLQVNNIHLEDNPVWRERSL